MLMHVLYSMLAQEHSKQISQGQSCVESAQYNYINLCFSLDVNLWLFGKYILINNIIILHFFFVNRTGKRSTFGLLKDGVNSCIRYYRNNFADGFRQVSDQTR